METRTKEKKKNGYRYLVGTSFRGLTVPTSNVIKTSDFVLIHGNGGSKPEQIQDLIDKTKKVEGYRVMPIINNEDDHFDFEKEKRPEERQIENEKAIDERNEFLARHFCNQPCIKRGGSQHHEKCCSEEILERVATSSDSHLIAQRPQDQIGSQQAEEIEK